jgi:hypothetical protein
LVLVGTIIAFAVIVAEVDNDVVVDDTDAVDCGPMNTG